MCGRFARRELTWAQLCREYELASMPTQLPIFPRYNIAPTQDVLTIRQSDDGREATKMRWGLVPSWAKDLKSGPPLINARADTLAQKPAFRTAYRKRRCLIPADGFYEWQKVGKAKQPYFIHSPAHEPFAFAGLWERWHGGPTIESCTIITTEANAMMREMHDRMPVILARGD